ncbi:MAG: hypothetical protein IMF19_10005, partial [Proteobacteria bacterium]|nr:hypothetical protein [Pseudomonadota bacterium]
FSRESPGFYFESSSMELAQPVSHETTRKETESAFTNYRLPIVSQQPPVVSHTPSAVSYEDLATYILTSRSDFTTPLFSYYSFKPTFFKSSSMELAQPVSRETTRIETEKESAVINYQLPVATHQPPVVSHKLSAVSNKNLDTYILASTSDFITPLFSYYSTQKIKADMGEKAIYDILPYFNFMNEQSHLNTSGVEKAPIYHTYPKIEHVTSTHREVIKERVIEKEVDSKPPQGTPQLTSIDLNRLTDQVYQMLARKIRIERERRGLLCR